MIVIQEWGDDRWVDEPVYCVFCYRIMVESNIFETVPVNHVNFQCRKCGLTVLGADVVFRLNRMEDNTSGS